MNQKDRLIPDVFYANLMQEIKVRIEYIQYAVKGSMFIPVSFVNEFCYLQLRYICELTAFACLTAHGDIIPNRLKQTYSPDQIIKSMEQLKPDFYPVPCVQKKTGEGAFHLEEIAEGFLSKSELLKLYGICGDKLHRGTVNKLHTEQMSFVPNYPEIIAWCQKIVNLLQVHRISIRDGEEQLLCILWNKDDGMKVQVARATAKSAQ